MLQMSQGLKQHAGPPLVWMHLPIVQDALQFSQGDAISIRQDGQHKISELLLRLPTCSLFRCFLQLECPRNGWRKDDLKATDTRSLLHTSTFNNLRSLPIAYCCPFDGSQQHCTQLARAIIDEYQSLWVG